MSITHVELALLADLQQTVAKLYQARTVLIERLAAGARVEPGPLTVHVEAQSRRNSCWQRLRVLLGPEAVQGLWAKTPPTVVKLLKIVRADETAASGAVAKQPTPHRARNRALDPNRINV